MKRHDVIRRSASLCLSTAILCTATLFGALAPLLIQSNGKPPLLIRDQGNFYVNLEKSRLRTTIVVSRLHVRSESVCRGTIEVFDAT